MNRKKQLLKTILVLVAIVLSSNYSNAQTMMQLPNHTGTYSSAIRGYWFTAPVDFTIVGLRVASQAGGGPQRIQVIKINDATPVVYSTTSTNFTSLALIYNATNGVIQNVNISITAGDKIGILGTAGTTNSYGNPSTVTSQIAGNNVTLKRMGYQGNMSSSGIPNYWTQTSTSGSISRVEMYYETCHTEITADPSPMKICEKQSAQFSASAIDVSTYQWQVDEGSGFVDVNNGMYYENATTNKLTVKNTPYSFNGNQYRCLALKSSCIDTSKPAILTVDGLVDLQDLKVNDTTCVHATKDLEVHGTGSIQSYQWQIYITGVGYIDVPNQFPYVHAGSKLTITNVQDTLDGSKFRCLVKGKCDNAASTDLRLTVNAIPTVAVPPADKHAKHGENIVFEVQATGGKNASYQWQVASPDVFVNINNGGIYSGVKTNRLYVKGVSRVQNDYKFRCIIGTKSGCITKGDTSEFGLLTVDPPVSVAPVSGEEVMVLYPNPTSSSDLFIKLTGIAITHGMSYKVVDKTGRMILDGTITEEKTSVDVSRLPADIYFVQILDARSQQVANSRFTKL